MIGSKCFEYAFQSTNFQGFCLIKAFIIDFSGMHYSTLIVCLTFCFGFAGS